MTLFIAGVFVILKTVITPAFEELELEAAHSDLVRADQAIQNDIDNLAGVALDWASWNDMYEYVSGRNPGFLLTGDRLATYANWTDSSVIELASTERSFIEASVAARSAEEAVEAT